MFFKRKYEQNVLKNCFTAYIVIHLKRLWPNMTRSPLKLGNEGKVRGRRQSY